MRAGLQDRRGIPSGRASLRANFAWTFAGNAIFAAGQWAILSAIAKMGGAGMLGEYALAAAVAMPPAMLFHLNLRAALATDTAGQYPFGDYLRLRLLAAAVGVAVIAAIAWAGGYAYPVAPAIFLVGATQIVDQVSDIYYGAMQRRDEMKRIAWSMATRAIVSTAALVGALQLTGSLVLAVAGVLAGRLAVLFLYDRPVGAAGERPGTTGAQTMARLFRTALPLGLVMMLASLNTNLPRYAIEGRLGRVELGVFAAVASFVTAGGTIMNALGQAATPRLAGSLARRDVRGFRRLCGRLAAMAVALGAAGVLAAIVLGETVLRIVYREEFAAYNWLLVEVMAVAVLAYLGSILGYAATSARAFDAQLPLFCAVAATCAAASWVLVPRLGLRGAPLALAAAACVQIAGEAFILSKRLASPEYHG